MPGPTAAAEAPSQQAPTPLGLLFELREQTPRTGIRWNGAAAKRTGSKLTAGADHRLGVRPVVMSATGNWVRGNTSWGSVGYQGNRLGLDPAQQRWFAQFAALHRSTREVFSSTESEWLYLDDFQSALLWPLLDQAEPLGIALVAGKSTANLALGRGAEIGLDVIATGSGIRVTPSLVIDGERCRLDHDEVTGGARVSAVGVIGDHGVYSVTVHPIVTVALAPTATRTSPEARRLLRERPVEVPTGEMPEFLADHYPRLRRSVAVRSTDGSVALPETPPPVLVLTAAFAAEHVLHLDWTWDYDGERLPLTAPTGSSQPARAVRDAAFENAVVAGVAEALGQRELRASDVLSGLATAEFCADVLPSLRTRASVRVETVGAPPDYRELVEVPKLTITAVESQKRDWFDLGVVVTVGGRTVPFLPLFTALAKGKKKLLLVDGTYLSLAQPVFDDLRRLIEEAAGLDEWETGLRVSRYQTSLMADFEDLADETHQAIAWREAARALGDVTRLEKVQVSAGVDAELRPYQHEGFTWLAFLYRYGLGGILADDMGLGKTLQTLALIAHADADRPFLVVAPTSVVPTWLTEAARFTPGLTVRGVGSTEQAGGGAIRGIATGAHVVVTSYALFRLDFAAYQGVEWAGLILDEAQFVKNPASQAHRCAVELNAPFTLAITGTPMENSLLDLWALFAVVAPGLFPSMRRFTEQYLRPIERGDAPELVARLQRRIRPLLLRRTKELVAAELPAKQEQVIRVDLTPEHRAIYDTFLQRERQKLLGLIDDLDRNRFIVFRSLTLLRMLSLDASLIDQQYAGIASSKLDALMERLDDVVAEGHRALVFSQFTTFLQKAADRLDAAQVAYEYLDGSTLRRAEVIERFRSGDAPVFLISLKAGGFGLNLTEADYVFLLDPWWNPASEAQAVDRVHRIGQTRSVNVYRLVAEGTIEEKVMALRDRKAQLFDAVLDDDAGFGAALSAADLRGLLEA